MDSPRPLSGAVIDMGIPQSEHRMDEKPRHRDGNDGNVSLRDECRFGAGTRPEQERTDRGETSDRAGDHDHEDSGQPRILHCRRTTGRRRVACKDDRPRKKEQNDGEGGPRRRQPQGKGHAQGEKEEEQRRGERDAEAVVRIEPQQRPQEQKNNPGGREFVFHSKDPRHQQKHAQSDQDQRSPVLCHRVDHNCAQGRTGLQPAGNRGKEHPASAVSGTGHGQDFFSPSCGPSSILFR